LSGRRVLVADDEPQLRWLLAQILQDLGFKVVGAAAEGVEAVELARAHAPEAILIDLRMPNLDGIEATRQICSEASPTVVVLSAYADPALQQAALEAGARTCLVKGCGISELAAALSA